MDVPPEYLEYGDAGGRIPYRGVCAAMKKTRQ